MCSCFLYKNDEVYKIYHFCCIPIFCIKRKLTIKEKDIIMRAESIKF